jgi:hypothetical protein
MLIHRTLCSPSTEMLCPWTEAEAMIETVVVVALCQDLFKQMQCQAAGREYAFSEGLAFPQIQRKEGRGGQVTGP